MEHKRLNSRAHIGLLVRTFYSRVRQDDLIGPIFNSQIKDWEVHLEKLTDFWETNLLFVRKYKGNPIKVHNEVDKNNNEGTTQVHFGRWLQLWFETINSNFIGERAELAKQRARLMSTHFFLKMYADRKKKEEDRMIP